MTRIIALLALALVAGSACAFKCVEYVDKDGVGRWDCRVISSGVHNYEQKELKVPTDVSVVGATKPGDGFIVHDNTNNITKLCVNMHGTIVCN